MWYYYSIRKNREDKETDVKKVLAFTLSEALVTLAIIGVLAAILIPVLDNFKPDKDKITYKKALYSLQKAIGNAMDSAVYTVAANSAAYWRDEKVTEEAFCEALAEALNTSGEINCTKESLPSGGSSYAFPNFTTDDGIRFWGLEGKFKNKQNDRIIYVDRTLGENELNIIGSKRGRGDPNENGMKIRVGYDGRVDTPDTDDYEFENGLIEMSLQSTEGHM